MRSTQVGLLLGAALGAVLVFRGFGEMLIVALAASIGWVVAAVISGDLDVTELLDRSSRNQTARKQ